MTAGPWTPPPGARPSDGWPAGSPQPRPRSVRIAVWLGLASVGLALVAAVVAAFGLVTFFVGGFLLVFLAAAIGVVAVVLAVVSVVAAARASAEPGSLRALACLPAALVLLAGGALVVELVRPDPAPLPPVPEAVRDPGASPGAVVRAAVASLARGEDEEVCGLLAAAARRPDCGDQPLCTVAAGCEGVPRLREITVAEQGDRAVARFLLLGSAFGEGRPQRVRMVREDSGWRLLDVPGLVDDCVTASPQPEQCPVVRR